MIFREGIYKIYKLCSRLIKQILTENSACSFNDLGNNTAIISVKLIVVDFSDLFVNNRLEATVQPMGEILHLHCFAFQTSVSNSKVT